MHNLGIKATIFDFFVYFIPGLFFVFLTTINIMVLLPNCVFSVFMAKKFFCMVDKIPGFFTIVLFIAVSYLFGLILSAFASVIVGHGCMKLICKLFKKESVIAEVLPDGMLEKLKEKFKHDFDCVFECVVNKDIRLCIISLVKNKPRMYEKAEIFQRIYGTFRTLCIIFLITFIYTIIFTVTHFNLWKGIYCGILFLGTVFSLHGYYRFYRYYFQDILFSYYTI